LISNTNNRHFNSLLKWHFMALNTSQAGKQK
jgi:hypothetical protein